MENSKAGLTEEQLKKFKENLESDPKNILALNACFKTDPLEVCMKRHMLQTTNHVFQHKVEEVKPMTNQKSTGRCWAFAALNVLRVPFVKQHQIEDFEFSQAHLFFWDKIERCNYFLHTVVEVLKRGEKINDRLMSFLLTDPLADGGQWEMLVNLILKYGVIPKKCFPESFSSESSGRMNAILKSKLRQYTRELNIMVQNKEDSSEEMEKKILSFMDELYRIISICLGVPPEEFTWEYYNKSKAHCSVGPITPVKFYEEYVKPYCDVESKVCLINDPRPDNPYGQTYTVDCLGNMVGGRDVLYINLEVDNLMKYAAEAIKDNQAVWFGCEVQKRYSMKLGISDPKLHDYQLVFGTDINLDMPKGDRLLFGDTVMNHAMTFTGVSFDSNGTPTKFRVENSWGDDKADKGYFVMTSDWFKEFGFEVIVDKKYLPKEIVDIGTLKPKILPAWDPMGSLAL